MIARCIRRTSTRTSFKQTAAYVLNAKDGGRDDPLDWKLADYILDHGNAGEKVASHRISNCDSEDPRWAVKECLALAGQNTRSTKDKTYHLVISFPKGERPTEEQMIDIEDTMVNAIGFEGHKRISAIHQNTAYWHLHVAIVTVDPKTLRNVTPYYDGLRQQEACAALEIKHNLTRTDHSLTPERAMNGRAKALEAHAGRVSFARWVMENAAEPLIAAAAAARTWDDLHRAAADYGVVIKPRGAGLVISSAKEGRANIKASAVDRSLSHKALTDRLGPYEPPSTQPSQEAPSMQYIGAPHRASPETANLWEKYQAERKATLEARTKALANLRNGHLRYTHDLQQWHKQRYANAAAQHLSRADRMTTYRRLDADKAADHARRKVMEKEDRQKVKDTNPVITWSGFLTREAARGNKPAVKSLDRFVTRQIEAPSAERD